MAYGVMSRSGMEYGSSFRNITEAKANAGLCAGTLVVPDTAALMPHHHQTRFIVHPIMLGSRFYIAVFATCGAELSDISLRVPTYVKCLRISHRAERVPGDQLRVFASAETSEATNAMNATVAVFDNDERIAEARPDIEIIEIMATKLPTKGSNNDLGLTRDLCYKLTGEITMSCGRPWELALSLRILCNMNGT